MKKLLHLSWQMFLKIIWRLAGGRREKAMGLNLNLHPDTVWPGRRGLRLPHENHLSKIVAYTDLVQAYAIFNAVAAIQNPVIIIVGAHHGEYAVLLGKLFQNRGDGVVIAIEPDAINLTILKNNIVRNALQRVVHVVESAVSDFKGEMDFVSQGSEGYLNPGYQTVKGVFKKVKVETLRDILVRFQLVKVDLLLVDVEGAELPVIKGFPWENMTPGMILCELHPYNWSMFSYSGKDISDFLKEHQYRCIDMYLKEHSTFDDSAYIGPCLFLPR